MTCQYKIVNFFCQGLSYCQILNTSLPNRFQQVFPLSSLGPLNFPSNASTFPALIEVSTYTSKRTRLTVLCLILSRADVGALNADAVLLLVQKTDLSSVLSDMQPSR